MAKKDLSYDPDKDVPPPPRALGVFLRTEFNYSMDQASLDSSLHCKDPSKTQQDGKDDADINVIMERYARTGQFKPPVGIPQYGDFTGVQDFQTALNLVIRAEDSFMQLPAKLRSRFHNDPAAFLKYLDEPKNLEEAIELGIVERPPVSEAKPSVKEESKVAEAPPKAVP